MAKNKAALNYGITRSLKMQFARCLLFLTMVSMTILVSGCVDGPLFGLKRANPYYQNQWKKDSEKGPTYAERLDEMRSLKSQITSMSPAEQEQYTKTVSDVYQYETSPELRREAVLALTTSTAPQAEKVLIKACNDKVEKVRIAACKALKSRNSDDAAKMLATIAQTDSSMSVKQAAIESLGAYRSPEAKTMLRRALDEKSPALQYQATLALKEMTGRDFEGNVDSWKQFLDAGGGPETDEQASQASLAERMFESLPFKR